MEAAPQRGHARVVLPQPPIHKLPPELLAKIFVFAKQHELEEFYKHDSVVGSGADRLCDELRNCDARILVCCRKWYSVALDTPEYWSFICLDGIVGHAVSSSPVGPDRKLSLEDHVPPAVLRSSERALELSRSAPLSIIYCETESRRTWCHSDALQVTSPSDMLYVHFKRCRSYIGDGSSSLVLLQELSFRCNLSNLQSVWVHGVGRGIPHMLFENALALPNLRTLTSCSREVWSYFPIACPRTTTLILRTQGLFSPQIARMQEALPKITDLHLFGVYAYWEFGSVSFPSLRRLVAHGSTGFAFHVLEGSKSVKYLEIKTQSLHDFKLTGSASSSITSLRFVNCCCIEEPSPSGHAPLQPGPLRQPFSHLLGPWTAMFPNIDNLEIIASRARFPNSNDITFVNHWIKALSGPTTTVFPKLSDIVLEGQMINLLMLRELIISRINMEETCLDCTITIRHCWIRYSEPTSWISAICSLSGLTFGCREVTTLLGLQNVQLGETRLLTWLQQSDNSHH